MGNKHYYKDWTNQRFGKLVVVKYLYTNKRRKAVWLCKCDCGNYTEQPSERLVTGNTRSCGCLHIEATKKNIRKAIEHNTINKTVEERDIYKKFQQMKKRCYSPKCKAYNNYGGRGIDICSEWLNDYRTFIEWSLNNGYQKGLSIDRIDNNKGYYPENCRWVNNLTQQNNKRNNRYLEFEGEKYTIAEWSRIKNIPAPTISDRLRRKYTIDKVLNSNYTRKV